MKKLIMALVALVCMVGSGFALTAEKKIELTKIMREMSDKELMEMVTDLKILERFYSEDYINAYAVGKGLSLEEWGYYKSAIKAEYNRRTNPSTADKLKDKASKASDWFWGKVGISE